MRPNRQIILETVLKQAKENPAFFEALFSPEFLRETNDEKIQHARSEEQLKAFAYSPIWRILEKRIHDIEEHGRVIAREQGKSVDLLAPSKAQPIKDIRDKLRELKRKLQVAKKDQQSKYSVFNAKISDMLRRGTSGVRYDEAGAAKFQEYILHAEEKDLSVDILNFLYDNHAMFETMFADYKSNGLMTQQAPKKVDKEKYVRTDGATEVQKMWEGFQIFRHQVAALDQDLDETKKTKAAMEDGKYLERMKSLHYDYMVKLLDTVNYIQNYVTSYVRNPSWDERFLGMFKELITRLVEGLNKTAEGENSKTLKDFVIVGAKALASTDQKSRQALVDYFVRKSSFVDLGNGQFGLVLAANAGGTMAVRTVFTVAGHTITRDIFGIPFAAEDSNNIYCSLKLITRQYELDAVDILADSIKITPQRGIKTKILNSDGSDERVYFSVPKDFASAGVPFVVSVNDDAGKEFKTVVTLKDIVPFHIEPKTLEMLQPEKTVEPLTQTPGFRYKFNIFELLGLDRSSCPIELGDSPNVVWDMRGNITVTHYPEAQQDFDEDFSKRQFNNYVLCKVYPKRDEEFDPFPIVIELPREQLNAGVAVNPKFYFAIPRTNICEKLLDSTNEQPWHVATPVVIDKPVSTEFAKSIKGHAGLIDKIITIAKTMSDHVAKNSDLTFEGVALEDLKTHYEASTDNIQRITTELGRDVESKGDLLADLALENELARQLLLNIKKIEPEYQLPAARTGISIKKKP